jgi:hypothetical protein
MPLKIVGPYRREIRPQWFVRPPTMRHRNQSNVVPGAETYGSPSIVQPPFSARNSPKA